MSAETIAKALGGRKAGRGWMARCPAHDDDRQASRSGTLMTARCLCIAMLAVTNLASSRFYECAVCGSKAARARSAAPRAAPIASAPRIGVSVSVARPPLPSGDLRYRRMERWSRHILPRADWIFRPRRCFATTRG
jgi:hypothetical protein